MDGPLKNQVLDLCASSASFLEKKNLVNSQSYLCQKLKVLTQCMCRCHFLLQCDNTDKVDQQIHIICLSWFVVTRLDNHFSQMFCYFPMIRLVNFG